MAEIRELTVITHDDFKAHSPPDSNPERPERLDMVMDALEELSSQLPRGRRLKITRAPRSSLSFFTVTHSKSYMRRLRRLLTIDKPTYIDSDTYISPGTRVALERLAGASKKAIIHALSGRSVFLAVRPPSHHAGINGRVKGASSQGFCLVNATSSIASVLANHGGVAVIDIDAHHGNGTAEIFYDRGDILHIDLHFDPTRVYPFTGFPSEIGAGPGEGTKINIVFPLLAGDDIALDSLKLVDLALTSWAPDYIVISAGFDSYRGDYNLIQSNIGSRFFYKLGELASRRATRAVVIVLEGGYSLGLRRGLKALIAGLMNVNEYPQDPIVYSSKRVLREYSLNKLELLLHIYDKRWLEIPYSQKRTLSRIRRIISMGASRSTIMKLARKLTL